MMSYFRESDIRKIIKEALKEDSATADITTRAIIPADKIVRGVLLAKEPCVVCGLYLAQAAFRLRDRHIKFKPEVKEGKKIKRGGVIASVSGRARGILTAERVALNFISLLSGIATKTRSYVDAVKPCKVKIMDTRKTLPGLRLLEKYAVRIGGGYNHRMSLDEMFLIKDNHLKVIGNRLWVIALKKLRNKISPKIKIEVEVKTLKEFKEALKIRPDIIMLDNMITKDIKKAVLFRNSLTPNTYHLTPKLEASGGISLKNVKQVAACGIEMISIGGLTHSVKSIDISLELL